MGPEGEAAFGGRHFQELVATFTTPLLLGVRFGSVDLGSIDPLSIEGQRTSAPVILLGGRSWRVLEVDWRRRVASVEPAPAEGRSRWFGSARALHADLATAVEQVLATGESGLRLSRRAGAALEELRREMPFVDGDSLPIVARGNEVRLWTFAGGRANAMLAAGLSPPLRVRSTDNFSIAIASSNGAEVVRALNAIEPTHAHVPMPDRLLNALKYRICLPDNRARAVLAARLTAQDALEELLSRPRRVVRVTS